MEFLLQEKEFVPGQQLRNEVNAIGQGLLLHMLCCAGVQPALSHLQSSRVETRRHDSAHFPTRALHQTHFLGTKFPFLTDLQESPRKL